MANCTKDDDSFSEDCNEMDGDGSGFVCLLSKEAPCTRREQCALLCRDRICT